MKCNLQHTFCLVVISCLLLCTGNTVFAQVETNPVDTSVAVDVDTITVELTQFLPPLAVLIDSALSHSPEVDFYKARVKEKEYLVEVQKKSWANNIYITGSYNYGNINNFQSGLGQTSFLSDTSTFNYQFGVGMQVPLSVFYGRSARIKAVEASRESEAAKLREMQNYVRDQVVETYTQVANAKNLLAIYSKAKESSEFILTMSEERFANSEIGLDELGQNVELNAKYSALYENQRVDYATKYAKLERLVGVPFSKFEK